MEKFPQFSSIGEFIEILLQISGLAHVGSELVGVGETEYLQVHGDREIRSSSPLLVYPEGFEFDSPDCESMRNVDEVEPDSFCPAIDPEGTSSSSHVSQLKCSSVFLEDTCWVSRRGGHQGQVSEGVADSDSHECGDSVEEVEEIPDQGQVVPGHLRISQGVETNREESVEGPCVVEAVKKEAAKSLEVHGSSNVASSFLDEVEPACCFEKDMKAVLMECGRGASEDAHGQLRSSPVAGHLSEEAAGHEQSVGDSACCSENTGLELEGLGSRVCEHMLRVENQRCFISATSVMLLPQIQIDVDVEKGDFTVTQTGKMHWEKGRECGSHERMRPVQHGACCVEGIIESSGEGVRSSDEHLVKYTCGEGFPCDLESWPSAAGSLPSAISTGGMHVLSQKSDEENHFCCSKDCQGLNQVLQADSVVTPDQLENTFLKTVERDDETVSSLEGEIHSDPDPNIESSRSHMAASFQEHDLGFISSHKDASGKTSRQENVLAESVSFRIGKDCRIAETRLGFDNPAFCTDEPSGTGAYQGHGIRNRFVGFLDGGAHIGDSDNGTFCLNSTLPLIVIEDCGQDRTSADEIVHDLNEVKCKEIDSADQHTKGLIFAEETEDETEDGSGDVSEDANEDLRPVWNSIVGFDHLSSDVTDIVCPRVSEVKIGQSPDMESEACLYQCSMSDMPLRIHIEKSEMIHFGSPQSDTRMRNNFVMRSPVPFMQTFENDFGLIYSRCSSAEQVSDSKCDLQEDEEVNLINIYGADAMFSAGKSDDDRPSYEKFATSIAGPSKLEKLIVKEKFNVKLNRTCVERNNFGYSFQRDHARAAILAEICSSGEFVYNDELYGNCVREEDTDTEELSIGREEEKGSKERSRDYCSKQSEVSKNTCATRGNLDELPSTTRENKISSEFGAEGKDEFQNLLGVTESGLELAYDILPGDVTFKCSFPKEKDVMSSPERVKVTGVKVCSPICDDGEELSPKRGVQIESEDDADIRDHPVILSQQDLISAVTKADVTRCQASGLGTNTTCLSRNPGSALKRLKELDEVHSGLWVNGDDDDCAVNRILSGYGAQAKAISDVNVGASNVEINERKHVQDGTIGIPEFNKASEPNMFSSDLPNTNLCGQDLTPAESGSDVTPTESSGDAASRGFCYVSHSDLTGIKICGSDPVTGAVSSMNLITSDLEVDIKVEKHSLSTADGGLEHCGASQLPDLVEPPNIHPHLNELVLMLTGSEVVTNGSSGQAAPGVEISSSDRRGKISSRDCIEIGVSSSVNLVQKDLKVGISDDGEEAGVISNVNLVQKDLTVDIDDDKETRVICHVNLDPELQEDGIQVEKQVQGHPSAHIEFSKDSEHLGEVPLSMRKDGVNSELSEEGRDEVQNIADTKQPGMELACEILPGDVTFKCSFSADKDLKLSPMCVKVAGVKIGSSVCDDEGESVLERGAAQDGSVEYNDIQDQQDLLSSVTKADVTEHKALGSVTKTVCLRLDPGNVLKGFKESDVRVESNLWVEGNEDQGFSCNSRFSRCGKKTTVASDVNVITSDLEVDIRVEKHSKDTCEGSLELVEPSSPKCSSELSNVTIAGGHDVIQSENSGQTVPRTFFRISHNDTQGISITRNDSVSGVVSHVNLVAADLKADVGLEKQSQNTVGGSLELLGEPFELSERDPAVPPSIHLRVDELVLTASGHDVARNESLEQADPEIDISFGDIHRKGCYSGELETGVVSDVNLVTSDLEIDIRVEKQGQDIIDGNLELGEASGLASDPSDLNPHPHVSQLVPTISGHDVIRNDTSRASIGVSYNDMLACALNFMDVLFWVCLAVAIIIFDFRNWNN